MGIFCQCHKERPLTKVLKIPICAISNMWKPLVLFGCVEAQWDALEIFVLSFGSSCPNQSKKGSREPGPGRCERFGIDVAAY